MGAEAMGSIAAAFATPGQPWTKRQGIIQSVEADQCTLTVTIAGSDVPISGVRYATGVIPSPGLAVWLETNGRDLFASAVLMQTDIKPWGYYVDYAFCRSNTQPATPTGDAATDPNHVLTWTSYPPTGTLALWMSQATKTPAGKLNGSWSVPARLTGDPGNGAPLVQVQYSQDGTNWHSTPTGLDVWMRLSNDGGVTWGAAVKIKGDPGAPGDPGSPGSPGAPGVGTYTQYSPDAAAWHDPPWNTGDNFMRQGSGTSSADITARGAWGPAALFIGTNGADGAPGNYIAVAYKEGARTGISAPTGNGPVPSGWSATPVSLADPNNNCLWVSRATCKADNTLIGSWSTPNQFIITADYAKVGIELVAPIIKGGKTSFADTVAGFFLGLVGGVAKFIIGNATSHLSWDGSKLSLLSPDLEFESGSSLETAPGSVGTDVDDYGASLVAASPTVQGWAGATDGRSRMLLNGANGNGGSAGFSVPFNYQGGDGMLHLDLIAPDDGFGNGAPAFRIWYDGFNNQGLMPEVTLLSAGAQGVAGIGRESRTTNVTGITQNVVKTVSVTFTAGRFTKTPVVMVTPITSTPQAVHVSATDITTSGFNLRIHRSDSTPPDTGVMWVASAL